MHPMAPKLLNGFQWNLEYITKSQVGPHTPIHVLLRQCRWSGEHTTCHVLVFSWPFLLFSWDHKHPHWLWQSVCHMTCFCTSRYFLRVTMRLLPTWGIKSPILEAQIGTFSSLSHKILKLAYYRTTATIPTKFCTVIKNIKYSSWVVVQTCIKHQDGRWLPVRKC